VDRTVIAATAIAALGAISSLPASAQSDPVVARSLAATCANCHGTGGNAAAGTAVPGLAGQPKDELVRKLSAYKEGKLAGTIMPQLAKGYTEAQIDAIAGWFAAQKAK
jgi:sulfide dehydrogenase cytochrome subunit